MEFTRVIKKRRVVAASQKAFTNPCPCSLVTLCCCVAPAGLRLHISGVRAWAPVALRHRGVSVAKPAPGGN